MDRRVAQIRHLIDLAQFFQHLRPDRRRRNFASARFQFVHDFVHRCFERHETDRPFLARFGQAVHQFAAIERFMGAVALDDAQIGAFDLFVGGEAIRAL